MPRFQAVQAAHEILSDPEQKRKYDQDRANRKLSTPILPRRGPVPPPPSPFPPPPRRAAATPTGQNPFAGNATTTQARQPPTPAHPEKYAPYGRAGAQQWEKAKEEAQSKADAFRGFQQMKPGQSPTGERFAPPPPPRKPRYPTAQRPTSYAPQSAGFQPTSAPRPQRSWDEFNNAGRYTSGTEPSPGYAGLSRTQSTRTKQGFTPTAPGGDEPPAPRSSAYATYLRAERPQASTTQSYSPESTPHSSPQMTPQRPGRSPLGNVRSSTGMEELNGPPRPVLERISTRYGGIGGERTDVSSAGLGRSSSARNSPIDSRWHERERSGRHPSSSQDGRNRHRSSSPNLGPSPALKSSSSESDISSGEDLEEQKWAARPKAAPRRTGPKSASHDFVSRAAADGQAFNGQFPGTNHVQPPTTRETDSSRHQFRPPSRARNQPTSQAAFHYVPGYSESHATAQHVPNVENGYAGPGVASSGPNMYAPFHFYPREWSEGSRAAPARLGKTVPSLNGFPSWAVPSSVLPHKHTPKKHTRDTMREEKRERTDNQRSGAVDSTFAERPYKHARFADFALSDSSLSDTNNIESRNQPAFHSISQKIASEKFSASEWNSRLAGAEDLFRPTSSETRAKRSPVRSARSRAKSYSKTQTSPFEGLLNESSTSLNGGISGSTKASEEFVPGRFSDDWAEKLRYQASDACNEDDPTKTLKRGSKDSPPKVQQTHPKPVSVSAEQGPYVVASADDAVGSTQKANDDVDPMDIDDSFPRSVPSAPPGVANAASPSQSTATEKGPLAPEIAGLHPSHTAAAGVNLDNLSGVAPLRPSDTGLGDLKDLNTTLPFESKASPAGPSRLVTNGVAFSSLKALNLPKPPKNVIPPLEGVTQEAWGRYASGMSAYMRDWNTFNKKMLGHFEARQAQLDLTLTSNWMSALGDGPPGEEISTKILEHPGSGSQKAGYAAYRQWMEEDMRVREWWNVACERHRQAVIDLGRVREMAKPLAVS